MLLLPTLERMNARAESPALPSKKLKTAKKKKKGISKDKVTKSSQSTPLLVRGIIKDFMKSTPKRKERVARQNSIHDSSTKRDALELLNMISPIREKKTVKKVSVSQPKLAESQSIVASRTLKKLDQPKEVVKEYKPILKEPH